RGGNVGFRPGLRAAAGWREGLRPRLSESPPCNRRIVEGHVPRAQRSRSAGYCGADTRGRDRTVGGKSRPRDFGVHPRRRAVRRVDVRRAGTVALFTTALAWGRLAGGQAVFRG